MLSFIVAKFQSFRIKNAKRRLERTKAKVRGQFVEAYGYDPVRNREELDGYLKLLRGNLPQEEVIVRILKPSEYIESGDYFTNAMSGGFNKAYPSDVGKPVTSNHMPFFRVISHDNIPDNFSQQWLSWGLDKLNKEQAMSDARKKVLQCVAEAADVTVEELGENPKFENLNLDSLDHVEMMMDLEEKFNIDIFDEETEDMTDVNDIMTYLENHHGIS